MNLDPEDMHFIPAANSPTGTDALLVVGALNGLLVLYNVVEVSGVADTIAGTPVKTAAVPCAAHSTGVPTVRSPSIMFGECSNGDEVSIGLCIRYTVAIARKGARQCVDSSSRACR